MKAIKNVTFGFVTVTLLLFQLMTPIAVHADDKTPVSPTDALAEIHTPKQTEIVPAVPGILNTQTSKPLQAHPLSQSTAAAMEPDAAPTAKAWRKQRLMDG